MYKKYNTEYYYPYWDALLKEKGIDSKDFFLELSKIKEDKYLIYYLIIKGYIGIEKLKYFKEEIKRIWDKIPSKYCYIIESEKGKQFTLKSSYYQFDQIPDNEIRTFFLLSRQTPTDIIMAYSKGYKLSNLLEKMNIDEERLIRECYHSLKWTADTPTGMQFLLSEKVEKKEGYINPTELLISNYEAKKEK